MRRVLLSQEDFDFLKDLQHELNTQDTDGQADPRYWMVIEKVMVPTPSGIGDAYIHLGDGNVCTLEETVEQVNENIWSCGAEARKRWKGVHKEDFNEVLEFVKDVLGYAEEVWQEEQDRISHYSGAFLTKRECKKHIEANRHHYCEPHTFAMTALRNYEYERLLKILKTMSLEDTTIKE